MAGFPINLDISEYFDDLRKYSCIFVNSEKCKHVRDVENHIKSVFGLEDNICLVHKKFLIPKSEGIQILQQYDIFKIQKCNFYDLQIHKTKKVNINSVCEQKALNLTQSEKTIDLSCRPKQRIKNNICPSPGVSGTMTPHVDHKKCTDSLIYTPTNNILLNGSHNILSDKPKLKKKRCLQSDNSDDNDGNILDMRVKTPKRKKHSNCFSTDDGSHLSDGITDNYHRDITKDHPKKPKKRKKHNEGANDTSIDLASSCWESLTNGDVIIKEQNSKKRSKKDKEKCFKSSMDIEANNATGGNGLECRSGFDQNHSADEELVSRKKQKHNKSKTVLDFEENQYYSNSPLCSTKSSNLKKINTPRIFHDANKLEKNSDSSILEERKQRVKVEIDQMLSDIHDNISETISQNEKDDLKSLELPNKQHKLDDNDYDNYNKTDTTVNMAQDASTVFNHTNRKRKRKHKKKKKIENRLYKFAVGPTINHLADQTTIAKSSPLREIPKHVFFTEHGGEDVTVPTHQQIKTTSVTEPSELLSSHIGVTQSQEQSTSKPETWQDKLLQLASSSSKPVVFQRNTSVAITNNQSSTPQESSKPAANSMETDQNTVDRPVPTNRVDEDVQRCNSQVKNDNFSEDQSTCSAAANGCSTRKGLPDICKPLPIPNDLQNINLSDYPIIDKVVAEDLILFKVLKLTETLEPGASKPILARVNGTSKFPDRISLQIMEGCEECNHCTQAEGSEEVFTIELRWSDILEPRLFYP